MKGMDSNLAIVDTHAHLDMAPFDKDRAQVIDRAREAGVRAIITVGTDVASSEQAIEIARANPGILATIGCHPHEAASLTEPDIPALARLAQAPPVVAVGELGLDFYRNRSPRADQLRALEWQLDLAVRAGLPIVVHARQAEKEIVPLLAAWVERQKNSVPGVIHCFNGDMTSAERYLALGFYIALGAYTAYPSSAYMREAIRGIPDDRLVVETDCPFLPLVDRRGKRNEPAFITATVEFLAAVRGVTPAELAQQTTANAGRLFRRQLV